MMTTMTLSYTIIYTGYNTRVILGLGCCVLLLLKNAFFTPLSMPSSMPFTVGVLFAWKNLDRCAIERQ